MNATNKYLFGLSIEEMQKTRERIYERIEQNKKAPAVTEANNSNNTIRNNVMQKITINVDNINPTMANAIKPFLIPKPDFEKMVVSTTDVKYVEFLIDKKDFKKAREVMNNLKSVAKSIDCLIMETDSYLASYEV